jgi:putative nucleotide binding protein
MRGVTGDEWLVVLGVGKSTPFESAQPLVQALGTTTFALVDVTVTETSDLAQGERLYIGPGAWDRVVSIDRHLTTQQLSPAVRPVLAQTVERIIRHNQQQFIEYYNTTMLADRDEHPLALLSGLSPECRREIVAARRQRRFTDVADLMERVDCLDQPWDLLVERVLLELRDGEDTYRWLTA